MTKGCLFPETDIFSRQLSVYGQNDYQCPKKQSFMQNPTLYGAGWCPNTLQAKVFLQKHNIPFEYVNVDVSKEATGQIAEFLTGKPVVPTLVWEGKAYPEPAEEKLAELLGINPQHRVVMYGADWC
ncbi:glutaredoxin family protein, partial [Haliscomenobacter sp.]|uniref:glutaredoxin family protein n=1 Tax=Haliscomenobacter sp. TaxID=2717303 RepID=UPI00359333F2